MKGVLPEGRREKPLVEGRQGGDRGLALVSRVAPFGRGAGCMHRSAGQTPGAWLRLESRSHKKMPGASSA